MVPGKLLLGFCMDFVILSAAPPGPVWSRRAVPPGAVGRAPSPQSSLSAFRLVLSVGYHQGIPQCIYILGYPDGIPQCIYSGIS